MRFNDPDYYSEELVLIPASALEGSGLHGAVLGAARDGRVAVEVADDPPAQGQYVNVVPSCQNGKLGMIMTTTYASQVTCPQPGKDARPCPLFGHGCYGESGNVGRFISKNLNKARCTRRQAAEAEAAGINALVRHGYEPLRLHTLGDCPTEDGAALVGDAAQRYMYASGAPAYGYTHAWNVPRWAWGAVSMLRSCHTIEECYEALDTCYAPALLVDYYQLRDGGRAKSGHVIGRCKIAHDLMGIPCPAIWSKNDLHCQQCRLCWNDQKLRDRHEVIMFAAHGEKEAQARSVGFSPKCMSVGV